MFFEPFFDKIVTSVVEIRPPSETFGTWYVIDMAKFDAGRPHICPGVIHTGMAL